MLLTTWLAQAEKQYLGLLLDNAWVTDSLGTNEMYVLFVQLTATDKQS